MTQRVTATIDVAAIRHNLRVVRQYAPTSHVMGALKADAYGHGAVRVAHALDAELDAIAVACLDEAVELSDAGCQTPCVLLEGLIDRSELPEVIARRDRLVIHAPWQLDVLRRASSEARIPVWIKLDTGMNRLGFDAARASAIFADVDAMPQLQLLGWMTHLANADALDREATEAQLAQFFRAVEGLPGARTVANSAGLIAYPEARQDWVRPGVMLYGASPLEGRSAAQCGLRPAMDVCSRVIAIREVSQGAAVGYGSEWVCSEPTRVGVVAVGYGDGYPRHARAGTPVLIRSQRVPLIGRVSMDMITVDLRDCPEAQVGDSVRLWGDGLPAETVAEHAGTIAYDLFCGLTNRVRYLERGA